MKAIGYQTSKPAGALDCLVDIELPEPVPGARDILVEVKAVSVNPVDTKVRMRAEPEEGHKVLGYDAAGVVRAIGSEVSGFKVGYEVYYAGDLTRSGTNAERHLVDERIAANKPSSLSFAEAAALPLTSITAWELLFDTFRLTQGGGAGDAVLVIGGAGGVGSILIQLAKQLTGLTVIATASRPETIDWVRKMGADYVVDHRQPLAPQLDKLGITPRYVAGLTATDRHWDQIIELIAPRGIIGLIDDPESLDISKAKPKALTIGWEFMFTRSMFQTGDMDTQQKLLTQVADLVDAAKVVTTATRSLGTITAENLRQAHLLQESGAAIGKTVLEGF